MPEINSSQIKDGQVKRADLNTATSGSAVISKVIAGKAIELASSTGADAGTGDATLDLGDGTNLFWDDTNKRLGLGTNSPNEIITIDGSVSLKEQISAPTATTGFGKLYVKDDGDLYYKDSSGVECQICVKKQSFVVSLFIPAVIDKDYKLGINMPFSGSIKSITTKSGAGTCTITGKIEGTALGGTANSASTSETTQTHSSSNAFSVGNDFILTASSNSACTDLSITVEYERDVVYVNPSTGALKFSMTMFSQVVADETISILRNAPFAGTITKITTKALSGTATVTGKINTVALGGTANAASSSEQEQAHSTTNTFSVGDDIDLTFSANSSCLDLATTVEYERLSECAGLTDNRHGTAVLASPNTSVGITFATALPNANYVTAIEVPYQTSFWVTSKTAAGFTINVGTTPSYSETIGWSVRPLL